jgi:hypothetical protein
MSDDLRVSVKGDARLMFEATMQRNAARLSDMAARWTRGMGEADKDTFLTTALEIAFHRSSQYDPAKGCIGIWFAECLGQAARRRRTWLVFRCGEWVKVQPKHLEVKP